MVVPTRKVPLLPANNTRSNRPPHRLRDLDSITAQREHLMTELARMRKNSGSDKVIDNAAAAHTLVVVGELACPQRIVEDRRMVSSVGATSAAANTQFIEHISGLIPVGAAHRGINHYRPV